MAGSSRNRACVASLSRYARQAATEQPRRGRPSLDARSSARQPTQRPRPLRHGDASRARRRSRSPRRAAPGPRRRRPRASSISAHASCVRATNGRAPIASCIASAAAKWSLRARPVALRRGERAEVARRRAVAGRARARRARCARRRAPARRTARRRASASPSRAQTSASSVIAISQFASRGSVSKPAARDRLELRRGGVLPPELELQERERAAPRGHRGVERDRSRARASSTSARRPCSRRMLNIDCA